MPISDDAVVSYRQKYRNLKRKLKFLLYENECFQEELRKAQRKLLKVTRDKSFLLDQILQYESIDSSSSDSDATVSSDSEPEHRIEPPTPVIKKKKPAQLSTQPQQPSKPLLTASSIQKRIMEANETLIVGRLDGHMTSEEVERHLEARQALRDLLPEKAPLTVPAELFSNEPPGDLLDGGLLGNHPSERVLTVCVPEGTSVVDDEGLAIDLPE
ncbi:conserved hypothetical protein [Ixodes scapularis]|uniref:INO80 complex subunit E N-terminal domain-containing protein n=1 Tax=Ixodes scapularis TaxID=6945 RepID=B7P290_IXOSC|nr:conserved hypothetical protein [Ixodes scapularis]|eukprot:XP_002401837.1 conserved hypothetical protein [Ixodes scapularis]